jgi:hypothetical protein
MLIDKINLSPPIIHQMKKINFFLKKIYLIESFWKNLNFLNHYECWVDKIKLQKKKTKPAIPNL